MGCVYLVRNKVNGKGYIGKTLNGMEKRRKGHEHAAEKGSKLPFHRALRKYGFENFEWIILFGDLEEEEIDEFEMICIKKTKTKAPNGYNLTDGGDGGNTFEGRKHTEEAKRKIKEGRTPEIIERVASFHQGRKRSKETRGKISKAAKGRPAWNKGKPDPS